jgi:calcineurin-like phosphoesterase family protein
MNEVIRERWNATIRPSDHVYHLGDVALKCSSTTCAIFMKTLNGKKRLVRGNHDRFKASQYLKMGFEEIHGLKSLFNVWLTHAPMHPFSIGKKFLGNVHGHIHEKPSPPGPYLNVSVEAIDYTPISLEDACDRIRKRVANESLNEDAAH